MVATFTKWSDGDILYANDLNAAAALSRTNQIVTALNAGVAGSLTHPNMVLQVGGAGSTSASGWLSNGSSYYLYNGSVSIIDFGSLLIDYQKQPLTSESTAVFYVDDNKLLNDVQIADSVITNYSFETTGTGGSVFEGWNNGSGFTQVSGTGSITIFQDTTSVFDQTYSCRMKKDRASGTSDYSKGWGSVSTEFDATNVKKIGVYVTGSSITGLRHTIGAQISVGGSSTGIVTVLPESDSPAYGSKTIWLDVSNLSGTQTLSILGSLHSDNSSSPTLCAANFDCVFIETYTTGSVTKTYSLSPNGSAGWVTGSISEIVNVGSISDIGFRLSYQNNSVLLGSALIGSHVQSSFGDFGINFG